MPHKVSVYLDDQTHRELKAAASYQGLSLSEFMARSAKHFLEHPHRRAAAQLMDQLRQHVSQPITQDEIRDMRDSGRV